MPRGTGPSIKNHDSSGPSIAWAAPGQDFLPQGRVTGGGSLQVCKMPGVLVACSSPSWGAVMKPGPRLLSRACRYPGPLLLMPKPGASAASPAGGDRDREPTVLRPAMATCPGFPCLFPEAFPVVHVGHQVKVSISTWSPDKHTGRACARR